MLHPLLTFDPAAVDWARAQFALTAAYHWLFVPLTLGLALIMGVMETIYYRTGSAFWRATSRFWQKLFGVNFAIGVATGIILEFEFGTNWSNYSWFVGDIFGAPLAVEGIVAFFMESTFVAVMFFGWKKVSKGMHLAATWLTGLGATISAWWILVANAWMQCPVGCTFNPDTMRNEMTSFAEVALSPFAVDKFFHTVTSSWILGALFVLAVSGWYLLKGRHTQLARQSMKVAACVGLLAGLLAMMTGDRSGFQVAQKQPMKLAAMEALYKGGPEQGLTMIAAVNPFAQPDYANLDEPEMHLSVPYALSFLATRTMDGFVPGVNDILNGYTDAQGEAHPSVAEKMARGQQAVAALQRYRALQGQPDANADSVAAARAAVDADFAYFGYGYLSSPDEAVPSIPICFYTFRIMVGLGCLFVLFFLVVLFFLWKKDITSARWLHWTALALLPLGYVASECGWMLAEMGRQPWTIQDMLPVQAAVSSIGSPAVITTFVIFLILFTVLAAVEVKIMCRQIKNGPEQDAC